MGAVQEEIKPGYKLTKAGPIPIDWNEVALGAIVEKKAPIVYGIVQAGPHVENGVPYIKTTDLKGFDLNELQKTSESIAKRYKRSEVKPNDIVMALRGDLPSSMIVPEELERANLTQGTARIRVSSDYHSKYIDYSIHSLFVRKRIHAVSKGSTFKEISLDELRKLKVLVPDDLEEQSRISYCLSKWDKAIENLTQLISEKQQKKKALMHALLTGKKRFLGFDGEWKEVHLKDLFKRITRKNTEKNTNVVTISAQRGLVLQDTYFKKNIASEITDNYFLLQKDEFAYNKSYSNGYPMGAIKRLKVLDKAVVTTLYICFDAIDPAQTSRDFFEHFFEEGHLNRGLKKVANEGGRAHGLLNVTPKDFFNLQLIVPEFNEQQKIAEVLNAASKEIELLYQKLDALKDQKKGLMQQLLTGKKRLKF